MKPWVAIMRVSYALKSYNYAYPRDIVRAVPGLTWLEAALCLDILVARNVACKRRDGRFFFIRLEGRRV
jgi:hypothetical protein